MYISEVLPRADINHEELNAVISCVCDTHGAILIPSTKSITKVCERNYDKDGIYLSFAGTAKLLKSYHEFVSVIKEKEYRSECFFCGENGHNTTRCHHGGKLECFNCHLLGHKAKFCPNSRYGDGNESLVEFNSVTCNRFLILESVCNDCNSRICNCIFDNIYKFYIGGPVPKRACKTTLKDVNDSIPCHLNNLNENINNLNVNVNNITASDPADNIDLMNVLDLTETSHTKKDDSLSNVIVDNHTETTNSVNSSHTDLGIYGPD